MQRFDKGLCPDPSNGRTQWGQHNYCPTISIIICLMYFSKGPGASQCDVTTTLGPNRKRIWSFYVWKLASPAALLPWISPWSICIQAVQVFIFALQVTENSCIENLARAPYRHGSIWILIWTHANGVHTYEYEYEYIWIHWWWFRPNFPTEESEEPHKKR